MKTFLVIMAVTAFAFTVPAQTNVPLSAGVTRGIGVNPDGTTGNYIFATVTNSTGQKLSFAYVELRVSTAGVHTRNVTNTTRNLKPGQVWKSGFKRKRMEVGTVAECYGTISK